MTKLKGLAFLIVGVMGLVTACTTVAPHSDAQSLTFTSNITIATDISEPSLNDSVQTLELSFSEELDPRSLAESVKVYRIDAQGNAIEEPCIIRLHANSNKKININTSKLTRFTEGEEFKLVIGKGLTSKTGLSLDEEYVGYFATNSTFRFQGSPNPDNERDQIVIISDMHLGVDDRFSEMHENKQAFVDFLTMLKDAPRVAEIVIAGDMFDEWFLPMDYVMPSLLSDFHDRIVQNNKAIMDMINETIREGKIKVTYISGNHDLLFSESDVQRIFPGINQVREDVQGLGTYVTGDRSEIAIEHGHRYNFFCSPDMFSNRDITNNETSVLPPGYFFTRIATSSVIEGHPKTTNTFEQLKPDKDDEDQMNYFYYQQIWKALMTQLPVSESFSDKTIKTNTDGYTDTYAINDLLPRQEAGLPIDMILYSGIVENWEERQEKNGVPIKLSAKQAIVGAASNALTDLQAKIQYFDVDASKKIVVFGHTHEAKIIAFRNLEGKKVVYANSGAWIDKTKSTAYPAKTFVVITKPKADSVIETVNLYQFADDKSVIQWEEGQAITHIASF